MEVTLELLFKTEDQKTFRFTLDEPKQPLDETVIKSVMEEMIAQDSLLSSGGMKLVEAIGARLVRRDVEEFDWE
ncbi:DUF2922 domain-containing protein [Mangrovibacillus cuniculi]|uniref:DUF2922 domain-containing protein n=1 Tax=Mangrovibacillus cuniculi TaxID=2593652 RepID=A0A7S8CAP0_9BACI|nr:DUF2922 domain-containing protein [Mangrovibacillus cuniculi]QPC46452.1 DUF2922 domain-containing protein [Mangrovibacillus cuniculi]